MIHNNPEQVNLFIQQLLQYQGSYIYIHVDAKSTGMIPRLITDERVYVLPKHYDVKWGDYTQIQVNNYLLRYASEHRYHDFYSLHSGADLMIRPIDELVSYLRKTNQYGYYECSKLPSGWQYGGGLGRIALKWPRFFRKRLNRNSPIRYFRSLYGKAYGAGIIHGRRLPEKYQYYGGADWFTVRYDCVQNTLKFQEQEPQFEELFLESLSGAEIYYVSIFQMTKREQAAADREMLRYIDWTERGQILPVGSPNIIKMDFLHDIEASGKFFARKFDMNSDKEVINYFLKKTGVVSRI